MNLLSERLAVLAREAPDGKEGFEALAAGALILETQLEINRKGHVQAVEKVEALEREMLRLKEALDNTVTLRLGLCDLAVRLYRLESTKKEEVVLTFKDREGETQRYTYTVEDIALANDPDRGFALSNQVLRHFADLIIRDHIALPFVKETAGWRP